MFRAPPIGSKVISREPSLIPPSAFAASPAANAPSYIPEFPSTHRLAAHPPVALAAAIVKYGGRTKAIEYSLCRLVTVMPHKDKYRSFGELKRYEQEGRDFRIVVERREASDVVVLAPHGGQIEPGTSEVARAIAGTEFSHYAFEGTKRSCNYQTLHITSHRFDEPRCVELLEDAEIVLAIHGCRGGENFICMGGADTELRSRMSTALQSVGYDVRDDGHAYPGDDPNNICNRGRTRKGIQLELSSELRQQAVKLELARAVRSVLRDCGEARHNQR